MKLNIAVIFGGRSVEHEISILSAHQCIAAIDQNKYNIIPIYISKQGQWYTGDKSLDLENYKNIDNLLEQLTKVYIDQNSGSHVIYKKSSWWSFGKKSSLNIDVIFPVMHGTYGEDGVLQGLFETMNIPYVGCNILSSSITMDKIATKMILQTLDIPTLEYIWFYSHEWVENKNSIFARIKNKLNFPLIVKPGNLGSSIGINIANNDSELEDAIDLATTLSQKILIEPKITNIREINCAVLGDSESLQVQTSVCEEPIRSDKILSYRDKYFGGEKNKLQGPKSPSLSSGSKGMSSAKRIIPAEISKETSDRICNFAKEAFINLNCSGVVRIDFLIDQDTNKIYLCELNPIPGSLSFYLWELLGISFTNLTDHLIELAIKKHRANNNLAVSYSTNILGYK